MKNTNKIIKAIISNEEKFDEINKLYIDYKVLCNDKDNLLSSIWDIYRLIHMTSKARAIGIIGTEKYYLGKRGLFKQRYSKRDREYLLDLTRLKKVIDNMSKLKIPKHARKKFNAFFKNKKLLREEDIVVLDFVPEITFYLVTDVIFQEFWDPTSPYPSNPVYPLIAERKVAQMRLLEENEKVKVILLERSGQIVTSFSLELTVLQSKIYIEQVAYNLKELLRKQSACKSREIKRLNEFLRKLKMEFSDYILLEKIEESNGKK